MANIDPRILLDNTTPFDESKVKILDTVASTMYSSPDPQSVEIAHKVLSEFQNMPEAWTHVAFILSHSTDPNSKFFALRLLENCIQTRWNILPEAERAGIKQYVSELTLQLADNEDICMKEKHFINKVNENLVQIVKHEWPDRWPTFISEICKSSRAKQSICENNMRLLVLLSEEVFDFGVDQLASKKLDRLKMEFTSQFQEVFELCKFIIDSYIANAEAVRASLVSQTLQCLAHFLKWIPLPFIFETQLVEILLSSFWSSNNFRIDCVRCLTEISSLSLTKDEQHYIPMLANFWTQFCVKLTSLPADSVNYDDTTKVPRQMRNFWETFYLQLALCLTAFLKNHRESVAEAGEYQNLKNSMSLLVRLTEIPHDETFKICLDFWNLFADVLLREVRANYDREKALAGGMGMNESATGLQEPQPILNPKAYSRRLDFYTDTLREVRRVLVQRMAKPQEVYIQYDEETCEVIREHCVDTDEVALYNLMRDTQVLLTNLGEEDTTDIMLAIMAQEDCTRREQTWNPSSLNKLCYSIGAISGSMSETTEAKFLVQVIRNLLSLCNMKTEKQHKAIVASNIMHVMSQYPRFLNRHAKFLETVINKLFEFMLDEFPGIQKMACETFLTISQKCKFTVSARQTEHAQPLIHSILQKKEEYIKCLEDKHALYFYQALGHMISASDETAKPGFIQHLMRQPNLAWQELMNGINAAPAQMFDIAIAREITKLLTINHAVVRGCGIAMIQQLMSIFQPMLGLYGSYSKELRDQISVNPHKINHSDMKALQLARREVLNLIEGFVVCAIKGTDPKDPLNNAPGPELENRKAEIMKLFVYPLLQPILEDYRINCSAAREHQVLSLMATMIECLGSHVAPCLPQIFENVFTCTLDMIKSDFHSCPDHRSAFYNLLMMCNLHCFVSLFDLPQDKLRSYVESLVWAFKHEHPGVAEQGLQITYEFVEKLISDKRNLLGDFCEMFYFSILQEILNVLTDTLHRSGFRYQTLILMSLIDILESGMVEKAHIGLTKASVMKSLVNLIVGSFETVNPKQVEAFVLDLFTLSAGRSNPQGFQTLIRDFLIQLKEFAGNNDALFESEKQEALARSQQTEAARRAQVPGLSAGI